MPPTYFRAPLRRVTSKLALATIAAVAFAACSGDKDSTPPLVPVGSSGGTAGSSAGGSAGSQVTAGSSSGGSGGSGGGYLPTAGTTGVGGTGGSAGGGAGTAGSAGSAGTAGGGGGGTGGAAGGSAGSAGSGGSGGVVVEPTGCEAEAGGAGGVSGAGGAAESPCVTNPLTLKTTWIATASDNAAGDTPAEAVDADVGTRFSTGKDQSGDEWLQIDFGVSVSLSQVQINTSNANDFPVMFEIRVSDTSEDTAAPVVASGSGSTAITRCFPTATGRYLLISQKGSGTHWWSVHDLNVSCE